MAFTYFFRDLHTLEITVDHVIPSVSGRSRIRVWDAGCASGQEPYTLAILFAEKMGKFAFKNLQIDASDIDGSNLFEEIISTGIYPEEELKRIPKELFNKYFHTNGKPGYYEIDINLRSRMKFHKHDLLSLKPFGDGYSLIICKNVLLHFSYQQRIEVIKMYHKVLMPNGYLSMEQTQKMPEELADYFVQVTTDAQLFKKVELPK